MSLIQDGSDFVSQEGLEAPTEKLYTSEAGGSVATIIHVQSRTDGQ